MKLYCVNPRLVCLGTCFVAFILNQMQYSVDAFRLVISKQFLNMILWPRGCFWFSIGLLRLHLNEILNIKLSFKFP